MSCHRGIEPAREPRLKGEIFLDGQTGDEVELLENDADHLAPRRRARAFGQARDVDAVEQDFAAVGVIEGADEMQQSAFAAAGLAHHRERFARAKRKIDPAQHGEGALRGGVGFSQIRDAQQRRMG